MRDHQVSLPRILTMHPAVVNEVIELIDKIEAGFPLTMKVRVVQALRNESEQNGIFALGRTVKNPDGVSVKQPMGNVVTKAKFGQSFHNFGLAFDFALMYDQDGNGSYEFLSWEELKDFDKDGIADWQEVVKPFKTAGWQWGGDFKSIKDSPHLEKTFGYTWEELLAKYNSKDFVKSIYPKVA